MRPTIVTDSRHRLDLSIPIYGSQFITVPKPHVGSHPVVVAAHRARMQRRRRARKLRAIPEEAPPQPVPPTITLVDQSTQQEITELPNTQATFDDSPFEFDGSPPDEDLPIPAVLLSRRRLQRRVTFGDARPQLQSSAAQALPRVPSADGQLQPSTGSAIDPALRLKRRSSKSQGLRRSSGRMTRIGSWQGAATSRSGSAELLSPSPTLRTWQGHTSLPAHTMPGTLAFHSFRGALQRDDSNGPTSDPFAWQTETAPLPRLHRRSTPVGTAKSQSTAELQQLRESSDGGLRRSFSMKELRRSSAHDGVCLW